MVAARGRRAGRRSPARPPRQPALRPLGDARRRRRRADRRRRHLGRRRPADRGRRGWRLLAVAPLLPVAGRGARRRRRAGRPGRASSSCAGRRPCPGYLLAIVGVLTLVGRDRLRAAGPRVAVELGPLHRRPASSSSRCSWSARPAAGPTSAWPSSSCSAPRCSSPPPTMAAALTLLGAIEARRQPHGAGAARRRGAARPPAAGWARPPLLAGAPAAAWLARFLVVAGLWLLGAGGADRPRPLRRVRRRRGARPVHRARPGAAAPGDARGGRSSSAASPSAAHGPSAGRPSAAWWSASRSPPAPLGHRARGARHGGPAAPQRGLLPLAGALQQRRRRHPRRRAADHLGLAALERALGAGAPSAGRPPAARRRPPRRRAPPWPPRCRAPATRRRPSPAAQRPAAAPPAGRRRACGATSRPASPTCAPTPTSARSCCTAAT